MNGAQSLIGDVQARLGHQIGNQLDVANSYLSTIADSIGTFIANIWSGGFVGVSNFDDLKSSIEVYSNNVQEIVNTYDATAQVDATFKGKAGTELTGFIQATKQLLDAYVNYVKSWNDELDEIYEKYNQGDASLQSNVSSDSQKVQQASQSIELG